MNSISAYDELRAIVCMKALSSIMKGVSQMSKEGKDAQYQMDNCVLPILRTVKEKFNNIRSLEDGNV
jgi:hypothetical protein